MTKGRQAERKKRPNSGAARAVAGISEIARKSPAHRRVLRNALARLLALGDRVAATLRQNAARRLHQAASLAVIGTLVLFTAACDESSGFGESGVPDDEIALVQTQELQAEVSNGLPSDRGQSYPVKVDSLSRDDRGVYYLEWQNAQTGEYTAAQISNLRLKLAEDGKTALEMPAQGDPILHLDGNTPIALVWPAEMLTPTADATVTVTPTTGTASGYHNQVASHYPAYYHGGYHSSGWLPFAIGTMVGRSTAGTAGNVDPSAAVASYRNPSVGQALVPNQPLTGSVSSQTAPPYVDRTISRTTVSGMSKGTGSGYAVTGKTGGTVSKSSFSSGKSGAAVTSGRSGAATGKSSGGVSAPKSGGFSAGKGSSSGGAAS